MATKIKIKRREHSNFAKMILKEYPGIKISHADADNVYVSVSGCVFLIHSEYIDPLINEYNNKTKKLILSTRPLIEYIDKADIGGYKVNYPKRNAGFFDFQEHQLHNYKEAQEEGYAITLHKTQTAYVINSKDYWINHAFNLEHLGYAGTLLGDVTTCLIGDDPHTKELGYLYMESKRGKGYIRSLKL